MRKCDIILVININKFKIIDYSITDDHTNDAGGTKLIRKIKNRVRKL